MYLEKINDGLSIKQLNIKELNLLCKEIRERIVSVVESNGGHLSSNLGSVELTVALHYVFDFKKDKIIFDVGHQSYAHKLLTGRLDRFSTIRKENGLSGFPDPSESEYDFFTAGHSGNSISAGLGYAYARDRVKDDYFVINLVGDASLFNGENLEAITSSEVKPEKFIVILNDNGMSINKNNNGLYKVISKVTVKKRYKKFNAFLSKTIGKCFIGKILKRFKRFLKRAFSANTIADSVGLKYAGVFNGHDLKTLIRVLTDLKESQIPSLLHVKTIKGKGNANAENDSTKYHGVSKDMKVSFNSFSNAVSPILEEIYKENDKIFAITAGMTDGVGLTDFAKNHKENFADLGICEEHAVTFAGGLSKGGLKPIVFIYSTFLQRSYDQIVNDICIENLPVVFCIDRAGVVGSDGKTHQGAFDLSYLSHIPNLTVLSPKDVNEFNKMLKVALKLNKPVAIRYPNGIVNVINESNFDNSLSWEVLEKGTKNFAILAVGPRMVNLAIEVNKNFNNSLKIINARTVKPLDKDILNGLSGYNVITLEENVSRGGFGESVSSYFMNNGINAKIKNLALNNEFIPHATVEGQLNKNGLSKENVISVINIF